jgi:ribosome-binding protein aMBF1 (putative translation factor)
MDNMTLSVKNLAQQLNCKKQRISEIENCVAIYYGQNRKII